MVFLNLFAFYVQSHSSKHCCQLVYIRTFVSHIHLTVGCICATQLRLFIPNIIIFYQISFPFQSLHQRFVFGFQNSVFLLQRGNAVVLGAVCRCLRGVGARQLYGYIGKEVVLQCMANFPKDGSLHRVIFLIR